MQGIYVVLNNYFSNKYTRIPPVCRFCFVRGSPLKLLQLPIFMNFIIQLAYIALAYIGRNLITVIQLIEIHVPYTQILSAQLC